jgi:hypothetical protein
VVGGTCSCVARPPPTPVERQAAVSLLRAAGPVSGRDGILGVGIVLGAEHFGRRWLDRRDRQARNLNRMAVDDDLQKSSLTLL